MVKTTKIAMKILYVVLVMTMFVSLITPVFAFSSPSGVTGDSSAAGTFDNQL